jgi:hypothetical protein
MDSRLLAAAAAVTATASIYSALRIRALSSTVERLELERAASSQSAPPAELERAASTLGELPTLEPQQTALIRRVSRAISDPRLDEQSMAERDEKTDRAVVKLQSMFRRVISGSVRHQKVSMLITMDPGQDLDDEMALVMLRALDARGLVDCVGVVATLFPAEMRATLAKGTLSQLQLTWVPVGVGTDGGVQSASVGATLQEEPSYMDPQREHPARGLDLMRRALRAAPGRSVKLVVLSSLKDVAELLREVSERLFRPIFGGRLEGAVDALDVRAHHRIPLAGGGAVRREAGRGGRDGRREGVRAGRRAGRRVPRARLGAQQRVRVELAISCSRACCLLSRRL